MYDQAERNPNNKHKDKLNPKAGPRSLPTPSHVTIRCKRNRNTKGVVPIQVRLPPEDLAVLDGVVEHARRAGLSVSRASVMADLVHGLLGESEGLLHATGAQLYMPRAAMYIKAICAMHHPEEEVAEACRLRIQRAMEELEGRPADEWVSRLTRSFSVYEQLVADQEQHMAMLLPDTEDHRTSIWVPSPQKAFLDKCAALMAPANGETVDDAPDDYATSSSFYAGSIAVLLVYGAHVLG